MLKNLNFTFSQADKDAIDRIYNILAVLNRESVDFVSDVGLKISSHEIAAAYDVMSILVETDTLSVK